MIEVISTGHWTPKQFTTNLGDSGIAPLQVTHIRYQKALDIYIRENVKLADGGFTTSSTQRWGMKTKGALPSGSSQVLEIAIDGGFIKGKPELMEYIKRIIRHADVLNRDVVENKQFTVEWAKEAIKTSQHDNAAELITKKI